MMTAKTQASDSSEARIALIPFVHNCLTIAKAVVVDGKGRSSSLLSSRAWIAMINTLDGRDKVTKLLQYVMRFLGWYYESERCTNLKASLANSRKAYRLGRTILEFYKIYDQLILLNNNTTAYRTLRKYDSTATATVTCSNTKDNKLQLYKVIGTGMKSLFLGGFWAFDNVSYLAKSGFLGHEDNNESRKPIQKDATMYANRCYFIAALVGLYINVRSYLEYEPTSPNPTGNIKSTMTQAAEVSDQHHIDTAKISNLQPDSVQQESVQQDSVQKEAEQRVRKYNEHDVALWLGVLKSCCDVIVFSNNPGVDLWHKYNQDCIRMNRNDYKLHEGFHCVCGMISSVVVMYNNLPRNTQK
jgi:Peroxisomal biogenesis factor 11 (PEX11)